jgi:hypothetical protein
VLFFLFFQGQIPLDPGTMTLFSVPSGDSSNEKERDMVSVLKSLQPQFLAPNSLGLCASENKLSCMVHLLIQLTLCLRHAHRILGALESGLQSVLCCTVFVNMPAYIALFCEEHRSQLSTRLEDNCNISGVVSDGATITQFVKAIVNNIGSLQSSIIVDEVDLDMLQVSLVVFYIFLCLDYLFFIVCALLFYLLGCLGFC